MYPRTATGMSSRLLHLCAASACKAMSTPVLRSLIRPAAPREKWGAAEHIHATVLLLSSTSWHRLGPGDMPLEAKCFRHVAVAIPELRVSRGITVSPRH
jgi:hypothetical protein